MPSRIIEPDLLVELMRHGRSPSYLGFADAVRDLEVSQSRRMQAVVQIHFHL